MSPRACTNPALREEHCPATSRHKTRSGRSVNSSGQRVSRRSRSCRADTTISSGGTVCFRNGEQVEQVRIAVERRDQDCNGRGNLICTLIGNERFVEISRRGHNTGRLRPTKGSRRLAPPAGALPRRQQAHAVHIRP